MLEGRIKELKLANKAEIPFGEMQTIANAILKNSNGKIKKKELKESKSSITIKGEEKLLKLDLKSAAKDYAKELTGILSKNGNEES